ncbi:MAG TPA: hypothetical protein VFE78_04635 [Gemmataceae bacterium]|jgi:hypothetical protein|nr:hypothetical protein [Gemmataceae bacterium]
MTRYRLGPELRQFTVQAFASGMLSFLGHSPTFAVRDFTGPSPSRATRSTPCGWS